MSLIYNDHCYFETKRSHLIEQHYKLANEKNAIDDIKGDVNDSYDICFCTKLVLRGIKHILGLNNKKQNHTQEVVQPLENINYQPYEKERVIAKLNRR